MEKLLEHLTYNFMANQGKYGTSRRANYEQTAQIWKPMPYHSPLERKVSLPADANVAVSPKTAN